ncbi:MarR family transcriptional regulator [Mycobacterium sp. HUMS_1102779]|uniref:MarR family transcriptional regulator n=1 Tax=Mycobacterium sp. HUMS_1102779 TaxID=3383487 RepID=UPI003899CB81
MSELTLLQAVRLKGRVRHEDLAAIVDEDLAVVNEMVDSLVESGLLVAGKSLRLSAEGRARLAQLLTDERKGIDAAAIAAAYDEFRAVNAEFKALMSNWQLKDGQPNTHEDSGYDAAVLSRLDAVHETVLPILDLVSAQLPRLRAYAEKLGKALARVKDGDVAWLTRPIIDSYHTVWFELHEELILAAGLTREAEAPAGHAQ